MKVTAELRMKVKGDMFIIYKEGYSCNQSIIFNLWKIRYIIYVEGGGKERLEVFNSEFIIKK